jgi:isocitrate/isopropylmalate dehydrogenase
MTETIRVACICGDGIGAEVVAEARRVLDAVAKMRVI